MRFILFILFVVVPVLEIAAFIQIGSLIGLLPTLASIVLTAVIGAVLVRQQGFKALNEARQQSARNEIPVTPAIHGVFILMAGLLLLTPGFVTDSIGLLFLVPPVRLLIASKVWSWISANMDISILKTGHTGPTRSQSEPQNERDFGQVIEGEAVELDDDDSSPKTAQTNSPWSGINHKNG